MKHNELIQVKTTKNIVNDACEIINTAQYSAHYAINIALVWRNWLLGKRIAEEELKYADGTKYYGAKVIANLSKELVIKYGKGFNKTNLYSFYLFYKLYPNIFHAVRGKCFEILSWTHYRILIQVKDDDARNWYEKEAIRETWVIEPYKGI